MKKVSIQLAELFKEICIEFNVVGALAADGFMFPFGTYIFKKKMCSINVCLNRNYSVLIGKTVVFLMNKKYKVELREPYWNINDAVIFDVPGVPHEFKEGMERRSIERSLLQRVFL